MKIKGSSGNLSRRPPLVEVKGLSVHRGKRRILHEINWTILPGEHWVILGPNGSGKSSLLAALTGYLFPSSGEIRVLGETFGETDWRDLRKHVGIVSSNIRDRIEDSELAIEAVISGKNAIINSWRPSTPSERKEAIKILDLLECRHLVNQPWGTLSQGERQRILIGRALMTRPGILILDEACAGLDPVARENFLEFLQRLTKTQAPPTLIFVTHHLEEIIPAFSRILMLRAGEVLASGALRSCITSKLLSKMFDSPVTLQKRGGKLNLSVTAKPGVAV
jgi:iron complex transport system ATP-binding protein